MIAVERRTPKKLDYEKAGVREYTVAAVRTNELFRFIRRRRRHHPLPGDKKLGRIHAKTEGNFGIRLFCTVT